MSSSGPDTPPDGTAPGLSGPGEGRRPESDEVDEDVAGFLRNLGSTLGKFAIYPDGHPTLDPAVDRLRDRLSSVLEGRDAVTLQVRRHRVRVGEAATDPDNPLLESLAHRLHRHQLRAVSFRAGVTRDELSTLLRSLAREPGREGRPLGLASDDGGPWEHLEVKGRRYDPLRLDEEAREAALPPEEPPVGSRLAGADLMDRDPTEVARAVEERLDEEDLDQVVALQLQRIAERLGEATGEEAEEIRSRLSRVILSLPTEVLAMLLGLLDRDRGLEDDFLMTAARSMEVDATLKLVQAAASRREDDIAEWLLKLVLKLSAYGREDRRRPPTRTEAVNDLVDRILESWELEDPRPPVYQTTLHRMARNPPGAAGLPERRARAVFISPERVLKMGLELDERVGYVREAADQMIASGRFGALAEILEEAPGGSGLADELWGRMAIPDVASRLLAADPPGFPLLERLVDVAGADLAPTLVEALASPQSESRVFWRKVFNLLVEIGRPVVPLVPDRLDDERWFVRRNMLSLLRELPALPEGFSALAFLEDGDPRVRAEALTLALEATGDREAAIVAGLQDEDTRIVGLALSAVEAKRPSSADPLLAELAGDDGQASSHRVRAVRLLAETDAPRALETLLGLVWRRRWIFWRKLSPASPLVVEALKSLARGWTDEPRARRALRAAAEADDAELRRAAATPAEAGGDT